MLLHTKVRKFQLGASLNQAKNENAPVDFTWKQFDISGFKDAPLEIPNPSGIGGRSGAGSEGGIPSDISYVNDQLDTWRQKISKSLSGPNSKAYQDSAEFKYDSNQIQDWAEKLTMLKSRADNFKANSLRLEKNTADDYAQANGKALVKDTTKNNEYTIVDTNDILTQRTKDTNGALSAKYIPATVGEALSQRFNNPKFSGFKDDTGAVLDSILSTVQDARTVEEDMDKMFARVGSVNESNSTFVSTQTGNAMTLDGLIKDLEGAKSVYASGSSKTNKDNLEIAARLFRDNTSVAQQDALRGRAIAQFINKYGTKEVDSSGAREWVEAKVNADIADRALSFLKTTASKAGKTTIGPNGTNESDLAKLKITTNKIALGRAGSTGKTVTIEGDYNDAEDLKDKFNILAIVPANDIPISTAYAKSSGVKGETKNLSNNQLIKDITGDRLLNNLFLADSESTPVNSLNHGSGLSTAVVNPYGGPMKILIGVPYTSDKDGNNRIAWKEIEQTIKFGKKYSELYNARMAELKRDPKKAQHLTREEREEVLNNVITAVGNIPQGVKVGDMAMIPILVNEPKRGFHDELENVLSSKVSGDEVQQLTKQSGVWDRNIYKTFAFSVLQNGPQSTLSDAYGPDMKIDKEMNAKQILDEYASTSKMEHQGFDLLNTLLANSTKEPTK